MNFCPHKWHVTFITLIDGVIKWWDMESGHMTLCTKEHAGWVTHFLSWIQARLLFSASNDSSVLVWAPGGTVLDRILVRVAPHETLGLGIQS